MSISTNEITALATAALAVGNFIVIVLIFRQIKAQNEQLRIQNEQLNVQNKAHVWTLLNQAERDFEELNKLMLKDPDFRHAYREGENDDYAKKYIFYELYYGYLERTYSFLHSEINPHRNEKFIKDYWNLLKPTVEWLLKEPMFREVHKYAGKRKEFKSDFISEVTKIANASGIKLE